jgi:hypothetical protein
MKRRLRLLQVSGLTCCLFLLERTELSARPGPRRKRGPPAKSEK